MLKIDQLAFIENLLKEENLADCNSVNIFMKVGSIIKMNKAGNYKETYLKAYKRLIRKLMYLSYSTRPDIAFLVK